MLEPLPLPRLRARRLTRAVQHAYRELWQRQLPHGVLSPRYLLPGQDERVRVHAQLWWRCRAKTPRVIWLLVEFWLWFRWVTFAGWRAAWRALRRWGVQVETQRGISRWQQARTLIGVSIGCCVPPRDVYRFGLFREPDQAWDFVYDHEIQAYHQWRSCSLGPGDASRACLADKVRQTEMFGNAGIPMAPILACIPRHGKDCRSARHAEDFTDGLRPGTRLFCKTRSGNRGIGAFTAWWTEAGIQGRRFSGEPLSDAWAVSRAWRELLEFDDALIQPALLNHSQLAPLAIGDDAITVRYITRLEATDCACLSATLEVPAGWDDRGLPLYVILPLETETGVIRPFPDEFIPDKAAKKRHAAVLSRLPGEQAVPDWHHIVDASHRAHEATPDLWAIAWDWVVTPDGPRLLEGNSGWGATIPQMLQGGFLRTLSVDGMRPKAAFLDHFTCTCS